MRLPCLPHLLAISCVILAACTASTPPAMSSNEIAARTTVAGKGVPNGRSDSDDPYASIEGPSTDPTFGRSPQNPIKVGTGNLRDGPSAERMYLNALRGPSGQPVEYERSGSCCQFETPNGLMGGGMLDVFEIRVDGTAESVKLYINMYDPGVLVAPMGFTPRAR